jgi:hypothetical protein
LNLELGTQNLELGTQNPELGTRNRTDLLTLRISFHDFRTALTEPPPRMSEGERLGVVIASAIVALSRLVALSRTMWDWDEALFATALNHYDVRLHQPHPPGFPLYVATAKILTLVGLSDFHALQGVNLVAACALFPVAILLCRELRISYPAAMIGSLLLSFSPNVWFFGGTALSDVPSMVLAVLACALLLRGCRSGGAYLLGALVLGIAAGFRPQNLLIGFVPAILSTVYQSRQSVRRVIVASLVGASIVGASYGLAIGKSGGWRDYSDTVQRHQQYISKVDSFHNPDRPAIWRIAVTVFVRPYRETILNISLAILFSAGIVYSFCRQRLSLYLLVALFGPFAVMAVLYLDHYSASRFAVGYQPLMALLAGEGVVGLSVLPRSPRAARAIRVGIPAALLVWTAVWMWPVLREVRRHPAPPVAAIEWIQQHVPRGSMVYVHGSMGPFATYFLTSYPTQFFEDRVPEAAWNGRPTVVVQEGLSPNVGAKIFTRPHRRLFDLVRQRYFEAYVAPLSAIVTFGRGWYDEEGSDTARWRWMGYESVTELPPIGKGHLALSLYVPLDGLPAPPTLQIFFNGRLIDTIHSKKAEIDVSYDLEGNRDRKSELIIRTDRVVNPQRQHLLNDARDLGVRLRSLSWSGAR